MKRSSIVISIGCFVLVTALLCINTNEKLYEKQKHFTTTSQVLEQMQSYPAQAKDERGNMTETNEFKECLSKRKRLTFSQFNFKNIKITKVDELDDDEKKKILNNYKKLKANLSKAPQYDDIQVERVSATVERNYYKENNNFEEVMYDLVFIDEGEGFVIDYVVQNLMNSSDEKKGDVNVEG